MFERIEQAVAALQAEVAELEAGCLSGPDAARLVEIFARGKKVCAAGEALAARRVEDSNLWRRQGHRSAAHWMAVKTGIGVGQAIGALETARRLADLPATNEAFRAGRLSETQAREIASAATACPDAENQLLDAAKTSTVTQLKDQCRRVAAAAAADEADAYERLRKSRYFRHWTDRDGAVRLDARLTPDDGALLLAAVDARRQKIFAEARAAGRREPFEAYAADALVDLSRQSEGPSATIQIRVDHDAWVRGRTEAGETCEIDGVGPIAVATARRLAEDAVLKAVVMDGADVLAVAHMGRTIPARLRTALEARDPKCVVPKCEVRHGLEIDHIIPFAEGGETSLANLARLCQPHHDDKTYRGFRLGGGPGRWTWTPPDGLDAAESDGGDRAPP